MLRKKRKKAKVNFIYLTSSDDADKMKYWTRCTKKLKKALYSTPC